MATPILDQISIDLAYKLQDPVSLGTDAGVRLSADERFRYIIRGYRRLLRMIMVLYPDLMQKVYHDFYTESSGITNISGQITDLTYWSEIFEIFTKQATDEDYVRANFISPEDYLKVKREENAFYTASLNTAQYFWTRRSNDIYILPAVRLDYELTYRPDKAAQIEALGQGNSEGVDIDIATEYLDMLLGVACQEAYLDIGQFNISGAYKQDVQEQLSLLVGLTQKKEAKDEIDEP